MSYPSRQFSQGIYFLMLKLGGSECTRPFGHITNELLDKFRIKLLQFVKVLVE